jgi:hypothetical protein
VAASSPFQNVRPHPLRERGLTFLHYNPAATLEKKVKVVEKQKTKSKSKSKPNQNQVMVQATAKCAG